MYSSLVHEEALRNLNFPNYELFSVSDESYENFYLKVVAVMGSFSSSKNEQQAWFRVTLIQFISNCPKGFCKKDVLEDFPEIHRKTSAGVEESCRSPHFLLKKETPAQVYSYEIYNVFKNTFFVGYLRPVVSVNYLSSLSFGEQVKDIRMKNVHI